MNKLIKSRLINTLKSEASYIMRTDEDIKIKLGKMDDVINLIKIIENYEELKPLLRQFFNEKARKEKWKER